MNVSINDVIYTWGKPLQLNHSTLYIKIQFVTHREHCVLPFEVAVGACCESHTEHTNSLDRMLQWVVYMVTAGL